MFSIGKLKKSLMAINKAKEIGDESGSVSMETIMDTVTRVLASVAVLGAVFGLLVFSYQGLGGNIKTVQSSGGSAVGKVATQINNTNFTTP